MEDVKIDGKTYKPWQFKPGNPGGPGRKPGKTLKEYAREFLAMMTDDERQEFMGGLSKDTIWQMAEGRPHQSGDMKVEVNPIPLDPDVRKNNSVQEDKAT